MSKNVSSPIPLKFHVWNPQSIRISNFEFHQNRKQKVFLTSKTRVFNVFKLKLGNFKIDLKGRWSAGHPSKCQSIITIGLNLTLHMVIRVASRPRFLATLTAKRSTVGGSFRTPPRVNLTPFFCGQNFFFQLLMTF